ncbi:hypothetical protein OF117_19235 [Geodermatophilus sp. YIM 151500]|uniref:hypothetical protein n=1 Tax=Geodermatophilus sp. YIM 151500 TaxID=2984531 RepID=UPI0021E4C4C2|nr:hypothetical protein [Geodermatophilus sp. YIM 151500]MCV2491483.1 hypothetical protein [Geodermatophilus sp. YIM 151500]
MSEAPTSGVLPATNGRALAGMICGIISVTTFWVPFAFVVSGLAGGIVAVVLGHRGRSLAARGAGGGKQALTALVCGYAGIVLSIANAVLGAILFMS